MADYFTQTNTLVKKYRDYLQQSGEVDDRPDTELTVELGNYWKDKGTFDDRVAEDPEFREQYLKATQATNRSYLGEVGAGISRASRGLAGTAMEAAAFGLDVVGADDTAEALSEKAKTVAASGGKRVAPTVREMGDIRSFGGAVRYGLGKIGEVVPSLAEAGVTAAAGAALAAPAGPAAAAAGAVTGFIGKQAIKSMIKTGLAKRALAKELGEEAVEQVTEETVRAALKAGVNTELKDAFAKAALNTAKAYGAGAANAINSYALSTGETYGTTGDVGVSAVAGLIAAIPDTVLPTYVAGKFFRGPVSKEVADKAGNFWERFAKEGLKTVPGEMGAEGFQEFVNIAAEKYHKDEPITLDRADLKRIREAAVSGAAGGLIAAPIAAAPSPKALPTEAQLEAQREARRMAAQGKVPPAPPAAPAASVTPKPPKPLVPALMTPEQQDLRYTGLQQLVANGTISPEETAEMGVIEALISQRAPGVARTVTPPAVVAPVAPVTPAPPVVAPVTPPPPPAAEVPALPTPPAPRPLVAPPVTPPVTPPVAPPVAPPAPLTPPLVEPVKTAAATPAVNLEVVPDKALVQDAGTALAPTGPVPLKAGPIKAENFVDFRAWAAGIAERLLGADSEAAKDKVRAFGIDKAMDFLLGQRTEKKEGLFFDDEGNRSKTRTGVALRLPDKRVIKAGLMPKRTILRIGQGAEKATGPAVQNMGRFKGGMKEIFPGGPEPILLSDLMKYNINPIEALAFEMKPGTIYQEFPSEDVYNASALAGGRKEGTSVRLETTGEAAPETESTAPQGAASTLKVLPEEEIADYLEENTELRDALARTMAQAESDPAVALALLSKKELKQLAAAVEETETTRDDWSAWMQTTYPKAAPAALTAPAPAPTLASAPVTVVSEQKVAAEPAPAPAPTPEPAKAEPLVTASGLKRLNDQITDLDTQHKAERDPTKRKAISEKITAFKEKARDMAAALERKRFAVGGQRGRETQDPRKKMGKLIMRRQQFDALMRRLSDHNYNIEVLKAELGMEWGKVIGQGDEATIVLAIEDVTNGNLRNVIDLIHEVGHVEVDKLDPGKRDQLERAVDAAIDTVKAGKLVDPASNADLNWEEQLVETVAIKLGEEGFGADAPTLAASIIRAVKDMYYRVGMAMMKAFGVEPDPQRVLAWFENNMRRRLGGDYDFGYIDLFSHLVEKAADRVTRFLAIDGTLIPEFVDPLVGMIRAEVLPDTVAAVDWNLNRFRAPDLADLSNVQEERNAQGQLLAPNGQPSKLTTRQWKMVRTEPFKRWFGDWQNDPANASKVLDENGEPKVMYHGTNAAYDAGGPLDMDSVINEIKGSRAGEDQYSPHAPGVLLWKEDDELTRFRLRKAMNEGIERIFVNDRGQLRSVALLGPSDTRAIDFEAFDPRYFQPGLKGVGIYTTDNAVIAGGDGTPGTGYAQTRNENASTGRVLPLYVSVKNPFIDEPGNWPLIRTQVMEWARAALLKEKESGFIEMPDGSYLDADTAEVRPLTTLPAEATEGSIYRTLHEAVNTASPEFFMRSMEVVDSLIRGLGYDGIQHTGGRNIGTFDHQVFIAFEPEQVKSTLNLGSFDPKTSNIRYRISDESIGAEIGMEWTEANARIQGAAYAEVIPILAAFKAEVAPDATAQEFWKTFGGKGDTPETLIEHLETRVPGSTSARIGGEKMTDDMNQHARFLAFRIFNGLQWVNRRRSTAEQERITDTSAKLVKEADQLNRTIREVRDADAQNSVFNENLLETIKELSADLDSGITLGKLAGKLQQAIRQAENLTAKEAIPREYQAVFKKILDDGGTSVFDYMDAIAKLDLDLDRSTVPEVMKAITDNAPTDSNLAALAKNRPLMVALSSLARNSTRQMNLLQLRLMKDSDEYIATKKELDELRTANATRIDALHDQIEARVGNATLRDRLTGDLVKAKRDFNRSQRSIQKAQETSMARDRIADIFAAKAAELAPMVGAFSYWEAHDGATYTAMQMDAQNNWHAVERTLKMKGPDVTEQHEQVAHDLAVNRLFLRNESARSGTPLYNTVERQTRELGKLDLKKVYPAATRFFLSKVLAPWTQKFGGVGDIHGKRVQQMLFARENVVFKHRDKVGHSARLSINAMQEASKAAGFTNEMTFFREIANDVLYRLDTGGLGLTTEEGLKVARKAALKRIPKHHTVADNFGEKMDKFILAYQEHSELMNRIKEEEGLFIQDPRVRDPLTGKGHLQRHAIKYGPVTAPRKLNADLVQDLVITMRQLGWAKGVFKGDKKNQQPALTPEAAPAAIAKFFNSEVNQIFVDPFVRKPGRDVFFGAADSNGRNAYVSQIQAQQAWEKAGGDVADFIQTLFDITNDAKNEDGTPNNEGLGAYQVEMLQRFEELFVMESNLADKSSKLPESDDPFGNRAHRIMDARTNELIPPEHFKYEVFSEIDALSYLNEIAFHSAFGRDGTDLEKNLDELTDVLAKKSRHFARLPIAPKKERQAFAAEKGWDYDEIIRSHEDLQMVKKLQDQVAAHFTGALGSLGDAGIIMEGAQFNMTMVMNTPKSGLMNFLQAFDFPLIHRGFGKITRQATWTASKEFARGITASIFTNFVNEANRITQHDLWIGQLVEKRQTSKLPLSMLRADIGAGGRFLEGGVRNFLTKGMRGIRSQMQKAVGKGGWLPFAPFAWISHKVDIGIATANVQALESIVKNAMQFYEDHPEHNNPSYVLTAKDLKMDQGFFTDEGAFKYYSERVYAYGMGTIENIVQEAMPRVMAGGTMLTQDQAALTAMMALDEVSLQSNINTRPDWLTTNPIGRMGGLMLGWPLTRINSVNRAFAEPEGKLTLASARRAAAVMAAWSIPMGLAYALLIDEYDEKIQGKKSNLRRLDPITYTPVVGPLLSVIQRPQNLYALTERLGRVGTYGLAGDLINSIVNTVDPTSGQRDFDLNSRILLYSQFANFADVVTNFIHQDFQMTYASVGRPLLASMGGNSLFQAMQIINNFTGMTNAEQAYTHRISVGGYLRSAGRDAGISLRSGARSSPTAQSVWYQQMALTAMANDRVGFAEAYRKAVQVARERGEEDPEKTVLQGFKARHPLVTTFAGKPTDLELRKAYSAMPKVGRRAVSESLQLFETYTDLISPNPMVERMKQQMKAQVRAMQPPTIEQMRRRAASGAMGY